jgi:hypothetical protein
MLFFTIFMLTLAVILCGWAVYQINKARKHQETNMLIGQGLDDLLTAAKVEVTKNKKLIENAKVIAGPGGGRMFDPSSIDMMEDPGMLATLITVIINKFGMLRLGVNDFSAVKNNEYVSVYLDTNTNELLLSLKHNLEEETEAMMNTINFGAKDDGTFH